MTNSVAVGSQWGDEGKAKIIDYLSENADIVVRFQGGANAGHTVCVGDTKFIFHMVPSGIMYPGKVCVIGNGVVFDPEQFIREVDELESKGFNTRGRIYVSDRAHVVLPYHKLQDHSSEHKLNNGKIGTTCRGIGPAYADKAYRIGIRVADMRDDNRVTRMVKNACKTKKEFLAQVYGVEFDQTCEQIVEKFIEWSHRIRPYIRDTVSYLFDAGSEGKRILFEGAQGTFLDIDHGTYPFVTSSNTVAGAACTGAGVGPGSIHDVVGIVKAYTTRVGNGPFPTELEDDLGEQIRTQGGEFGATTGRPRRCGWLDTVMLRRAIQLNGITRLALTKIDVLSGCNQLKICVGYERQGHPCNEYPASVDELAECRPVYETLEGWDDDVSTVKSFEAMPENAQSYIKRIQSLCYGIPVDILSVGPERAQTIEL